VCFCCAHAFNGLVNVWEVTSPLNHEPECDPFFDVCDEIANKKLFFADVVSINFAFSVDVVHCRRQSESGNS
jgi:hypothetical protein